MEQPNTLPTVLRNNPKDVVLRGLKQAFAKFGPLRVPIDFSKEYPSRETWTTTANGNTNLPKRRIVVRKINNAPVLQAIGDSYTGSFAFMGTNLEDKELAAVHTAGFGWVDNYTIEISVWTSDSDDRDNLVELIKLIMLELTQGRTAGNEPFFTTNGVLAVKFVRESDSQTTSKVGNSPMYSGSTTWNLTVPFYNTTREEYYRYKFELVDNIIKYPTEPSDPIIVVVPDVPGGGDSGGGGSNSDLPTQQNNPSYDGLLVIPVGGGAVAPIDDNKTIIVDPNTPPDERTRGTFDEFLKE